MAYPTIFLTRPIRRAIMGAFITAFFMIAPLVILYTAGYRFNIKERRVEQTGVISIDVMPRDATVYLNSVLLKNTIPMRLVNRAPGTYHISVRKDGFHTWEKDITVGSKQTTYIKNITLFANASPVPFFADVLRPVGHMNPSATANYLFLTSTEQKLTTIELTEVQTGKRTLIKRESEENAPSIFWSPWYDLAAMISRRDGQMIVELFDPDELRTIQTISLPMENDPIFEWQENADTPAFLIQQGTDIVRIGKNEIRKVAALSDRRASAWYIDNDVRLWEYTPADNTLASSEGGKREVYTPSSPIVRIVNVNKRRIIAAGTRTIMIFSRDDSSRLLNEIQTTDVRANAATKEWYAWSTSELWSIYADGHSVLLNRTGEKIASVLPLDPFGELLLATEHAMIGFNPGYYVSQKIFSGGRVETIGVNQKLRNIYFLGDVHGRRDVYELAY